MAKIVGIHYLEVVTPDVEQVCHSYSELLGVAFCEGVPELGNARTAILTTGGSIGVRAPMHEAEEPTTRPYYLVSDIEKAVEVAKSLGAEIAVPPMEIPNRGKCAILIFGTIQSGLWEV